MGEVPIGAVVVDLTGSVLARSHNLTITNTDPTAHAEILALRAAAKEQKNYRLSGTTLFVTVEPCAMCAGAMIWARVDRLVFGAFDAKAGAAASLYRIPEDERLNHRMEVRSGVGADESRMLMQSFFREKRKKVPEKEGEGHLW